MSRKSAHKRSRSDLIKTLLVVLAIAFVITVIVGAALNPVDIGY